MSRMSNAEDLVLQMSRAIMGPETALKASAAFQLQESMTALTDAMVPRALREMTALNETIRGSSAVRIAAQASAIEARLTLAGLYDGTGTCSLEHANRAASLVKDAASRLAADCIRSPLKGLDGRIGDVYRGMRLVEDSYGITEKYARSYGEPSHGLVENVVEEWGDGQRYVLTPDELPRLRKASRVRRSRILRMLDLVEFVRDYDPELHTLIEARLRDMDKAFAAAIHRSVMTDAGGILEGVLGVALGVGPDVTLAHRINRASAVGPEGAYLLSGTSNHAATMIRVHRNIVHIDCEQRERITADRRTAEMIVSMFEFVLEDLHAAWRSGAIDRVRAKH